MSEGRKQFTFYESYLLAVSRIKKPTERAMAYDLIANYAIYGIEPDIEKLPDSVAIAYVLTKPTLDKSREKANAGKLGGERKKTPSKPQANGKQNEANGKQTPSKTKRGENASEKEGEKEKEIEIEIEIEKESSNPPLSPFEQFWQAYPKKVGKLDAERAFQKAKAPIDQLLSAVERQKKSDQWIRENGRFIPNPATWLNQGRWDDVLSIPGETTLSELEIAAIRRIMGEEVESDLSEEPIYAGDPK